MTRTDTCTDLQQICLKMNAFSKALGYALRYEAEDDGVWESTAYQWRQTWVPAKDVPALHASWKRRYAVQPVYSKKEA